MINRRLFLRATTIFFGSLAGRAVAATPDGGFARLPDAFARIERDSGGRLGVAVFDTARGARALHRAGERFPMASTFKLFVAAAVLRRVDRGDERHSRRIRYTRGDLVRWSPIAEMPANLAQGMSVGALVEAATVWSDNTAANLLLDAIGGPKGLTAFMRDIGDDVTRLDRDEPALNEGTPGDPRDTSSPMAYLESMRRIALGDVLTAASRARLLGYMAETRTADRLLRARLPQGWRIADRSGEAGHRTRNVAGVIWPAGRAEPTLVVAFLTEGPERREARDAVLAEIGAAVYATI